MVFAQNNIVLNGDFEEYSQCPAFASYDFYKCINWVDAGGPIRYLNSCDTIDATPQTIDGTDAGVPYNKYTFSYPQSGNAYIALGVIGDSVYYQAQPSVNRRDIGKGKLKYPLIAGQCYDFKMYVKKATRTGPGSDRVGVYFTNQESNIFPAPTHPPFPLVDTTRIIYSHIPICDTSEWHLIADKYIAVGGEKYIYIGNFFSDSLTNMQYCYTSTYPDSLWNHVAFLLMDNLSLVDCDSLVGIEENKIDNIEIYPNPAQDFISIELPKIYNQASLNIYNLTGQLISQKQISQPSQNIPIPELGNGIYIFVIQNGERVLGRKRLVVGR